MTPPSSFPVFQIRFLSVFAAAAFWLTGQAALADKVVLVAGGDKDAVGVPATEVLLDEPFGVDFDKAGNTFIIENLKRCRLLKVDAHGLLTEIVGARRDSDPDFGHPAIKSKFHCPHSLATLPGGDTLVADTWNGRICKVDGKSGAVSDLPGYGVPPDKAMKNGPYCIALDATGTKLYVADLLHIQVIDLKTGLSKIVAGNGKKGRPEDGAVATESPLLDPRAVAVDRKGNIYILERAGHALCVVDAAGKIRTVVNASRKPGATGDDGPAIDAQLNGPKHLCVDLDDNVLIADTENHVVRKFLPKEGKIIRVAGSGKLGSAGVGGDPLACELNRPHGVAVHPKTGELYISDSHNNRILKIAR